MLSPTQDVEEVIPECEPRQLFEVETKEEAEVEDEMVVENVVNFEEIQRLATENSRVKFLKSGNSKKSPSPSKVHEGEVLQTPRKTPGFRSRITPEIRSKYKTKQDVKLQVKNMMWPDYPKIMELRKPVSDIKSDIRQVYRCLVLTKRKLSQHQDCAILYKGNRN
eukprot:TRINITY_DN5440_c0_g1_i1.p2 TRINITY_DN5440_c0_g1~~TRINITY_DN5440_c0_g1_i1.p2  ORF type:complete len:165 (+),score=18.73 TRINITY_DN5440_c0_g1_i1:1127-1621(+)